jgi:uncharacterized protein
VVPVPAPPDEQTLELLRSRSGLAVDAEGTFLHQGAPITHARTLAQLWSSLRRRDDGRYEVRIGRERAYVTIDETPWAVRGLEARGPDEPPTLLLAGGACEPLDPATLWLGGDGVVRCRLARGEPARFTRAGQAALAPWLDEDPPGSGHHVITVGKSRFTIAARDPA